MTTSERFLARSGQAWPLAGAAQPFARIAKRVGAGLKVPRRYTPDARSVGTVHRTVDEAWTRSSRPVWAPAALAPPRRRRRHAPASDRARLVRADGHHCEGSPAREAESASLVQDGCLESAGCTSGRTIRTGTSPVGPPGITRSSMLAGGRAGAATWSACRPARACSSLSSYGAGASRVAANAAVTGSSGD
jgi:hypothetical protein